MSMNKYNARSCYVDGIKFPSKHEAERYMILKYMQKRGEIKGLRLQVKYELIPPQRLGKHKLREANYIADFTYYRNNELVVEDAKGYKDGEAYRLFKLKKKLMLYQHGIWVEEV